jgi:radical SAM protein with 4Fe4S-binding SPASM domain
MQVNVWEYTDSSGHGELAYLSVALTTRCNLDCVYCSKKGSLTLDLDPALLNRALDEALELGLKKVEFTGGEPLLYPAFMETAHRLVKQGAAVLIVSNGTLVDGETAKKLADLGVAVSISLSTLDEKKFHHMSQKEGLFKTVLDTFKHLKANGYRGDGTPLLAIQSIASMDTFHELEALRTFAEEQDLMFIVNRAIPVGGLEATNVPSGARLKEFLDRESARRSGACIPFSADSPCNRLKVGCYIGSDAQVRPCPAIDLPVGDLKRESLSHIWRHSPVLETCRTIDRQLEGSCGRCPESHRCYGCRAVAYSVWGSLTAPDPGCFRFQPDHFFNKQNQSKKERP